MNPLARVLSGPCLIHDVDGDGLTLVVEPLRFVPIECAPHGAGAAGYPLRRANPNTCRTPAHQAEV